MRTFITVKRSIIRIVTASLLVLMFVSAFVAPAYAWTHEQNNFDKDPTQYLCGGSSSFPCLYWKQPHNTSITLYFEVAPSLLPQGSFNWLSTINGDFTNYNNIVAWNPYMYTCTSGTFCSQNSIGIYSTDNGGTGWQCDLFSGFMLGQTAYSYSTPEYANGQWYAFFSSIGVQFNHIIHWDTNNNWSGDCTSGIYADANYLARHESGHTIGLGHTAKADIMAPESLSNPPNYDTLQPDDIVGVQTIYDNNNPTS